MTWKEAMQARFPHLYSITPTASTYIDGNGVSPVEVIPPRPPTPTPAGVPPGVQQIADAVEGFMPLIEKMTGLSRRDISLQLLKTGFKGGGLMDIINGLQGKQQQTDAKFVRYVKTLAVWIPVAVFLFGLAVVSVILFAKLIIAVTGGL